MTHLALPASATDSWNRRHGGAVWRSGRCTAGWPAPAPQLSPPADCRDDRRRWGTRPRGSYHPEYPSSEQTDSPPTSWSWTFCASPWSRRCPTQSRSRCPGRTRAAARPPTFPPASHGLNYAPPPLSISKLAGRRSSALRSRCRAAPNSKCSWTEFEKGSPSDWTAAPLTLPLICYLSPDHYQVYQLEKIKMLLLKPRNIIRKFKMKTPILSNSNEESSFNIRPFLSRSSKFH